MKTIKALKIVAMFPLVFMVSVLLVFGIGETLGGDLSGLMHLVGVAFVVAVAWLAWKRPFWGGILMLAGAGFQALRFWNAFRQADPSVVMAPLFIILLPLAFSGVLLLFAAWLDHHPSQAPLQQ